MISIGEMLNAERVLMGVNGTDKQQVLGNIVRHLVAEGVLVHDQQMLRLLLEREAMMTTAVKHGIAFPHAFSPELENSCVCMAMLEQPVEWEALDGEPVDCIFLLLGPPDRQTDHLRMLARLSRLMSFPQVLEQLHTVHNPQQAWEVLIENEEALAYASA